MVHIYLAPAFHDTATPAQLLYTHTQGTPPSPLRRTYTLMQSHSPELHVKLLMVGNSSVGKSSLLMRWSENQWLPEDEVSATIGVEVKVSRIDRIYRSFVISDQLLETKT
jgi:predicted GTPase